MSAHPSPENTGDGPDPVSPDWRTLGQNCGGRPRKDGTRTRTAMILREAGFSKRAAARARRMAFLSDEEFEAALDMWHGCPRRHDIEYFLPDRRGNSRHERENATDISRLISTLRRIQNRHEGDASKRGQLMMSLVKATADLWTDGLGIARAFEQEGMRS